MSLQSYFENLQREHNATCVEFIADQAKCDEGRIRFPAAPSLAVQQQQPQRPSFRSDSERHSAAPTCPLRTTSFEDLVQLCHDEGAALALRMKNFALLNDKDDTSTTNNLVLVAQQSKNHEEHDELECRSSLKQLQPASSPANVVVARCG
ncbi:unnamed protein product [Cylindrotheca closterium]|uniref:Uncharacterized protein n=1 Tax=Cylindrotheca closterium TaxID=2856 RepID=A0AAD2FH42_9STRA|nr:unnamed protein product [Cylindrotheca closterium]